MLNFCRNHLMVAWQWKRQTASPRHKNTKWNDFPLSIIFTFHFVTCCHRASAYYQSCDCFNASGSCSYFHSFPSSFFPSSLAVGASVRYLSLFFLLFPSFVPLNMELFSISSPSPSSSSIVCPSSVPPFLSLLLHEWRKVSCDFQQQQQQQQLYLHLHYIKCRLK